jgi:hypothetical protein
MADWNVSCTTGRSRGARCVVTGWEIVRAAISWVGERNSSGCGRREEKIAGYTSASGWSRLLATF